MQSSCVRVQEALRARWINGLPPASSSFGPEESNSDFFGKESVPGESSGRGSSSMSGSEGELYRHLDGCTSCRNEADALLQLDGSLREGFLLLASSTARPPEERIEEVIQHLHAEAVEVQLLRRARRGMRLILWAAFYGFTLLAACLLAVALYRALQGN